MAGLVLGGRYELLTAIGAGGAAVVWRAHDHVLARTVAVKIVSNRPGDRCVQQEARAAAALSHPNIAQVHDYGEMTTESQTFPYVVMELVEGGTLSQRLAAGPVTPRFAMRVCAEIAYALAAAHAAGLVHRDIKPANVMLGPTGAKVVDFGIAAATAPSSTGELDPEVLGTPAYLAPERLIDDAVEPASDVYALGVVLYYLLSGHSPWTTEDTTQMLTAHIYLDPAPLPPVTGVPAHIADLCERCLLKDPAQRPSAREVAALLSAEPREAAAAESHETITEPGTAGAEPREPAPRRTSRWAAAAALLVAAGAAGWLLIPDDQDPSVPAVADGPSASVAPSRNGRPPASPDRRHNRGEQPPGEPTLAPAAPTTSANAIGEPPSATPPAPSATTRPTATTTPTATETATTAPAVRTLSSTAGTLEATCPSAGTAQILSYEARRPFKVAEADEGPSSSPSVTFKRGNEVTTMTVSCSEGRPTLI